ncbi:hypothetical protein ACJJTC_004769 [Scirpophaga incertulas]
MKLQGALLVVLAALCLQSVAKTFTRCELVQELRRQGFPNNKMRDWVCLVEYETARRTNVIGPGYSDGSRDHGLFQINDRQWCNNGPTPGKKCKVTCADLRTDDITKASKCAKEIYKTSGFSAWNAWKTYCRGKPLPDISQC